MSWNRNIALVHVDPVPTVSYNLPIYMKSSDETLGTLPVLPYPYLRKERGTLIIDKFPLAGKGSIWVRNSGSGSATLTNRDILLLQFFGVPCLYFLQPLEGDLLYVIGEMWLLLWPACCLVISCLGVK
jgi:hypothetical protein